MFGRLQVIGRDDLYTKQALKFALRDGAQLRTSMLSDNLAWVSPTQFRPLDSIGGSPMLLKAGFSYPYKDIELQIESISGDGPNL